MIEKILSHPALLITLLLVPTISPRARAEGPPLQKIAGLGATAFPTSTKSPEAQTAFLRGLLLLHAFEYSDAAEAFIAAEKLDPSFAMAYWGEAMTFNHGVWNIVDATAGKAALDKFAPTPAARSARITDPREQAYLAAVELLYDPNGTKAERDRRYSAAMQHLSATYPTDRNAQLFYALALLSQSEGVRDVPAYLQAAAISKKIWELEPDNPGAAHYWIHGMDDPEHAAGALDAARALSKIAPDAPHAQHMCSHIFMALGMWDDVVDANVAAVRVGNEKNRSAGFPPYNCGHYQEWLEYGYFQQGRIHEALETVHACQETGLASTAWMNAHPGLTPFNGSDPRRLHHRLESSLADMRAVAIVESGNWNSAANASAMTDSLPPAMRAWDDFTTGFAAAEAGNLSDAHAALERMRREMETIRADPDSDPEASKALAVGADELSGLYKIKAGQNEAGLAELRRAVESYRSMAFAFGPPVTIKPPEELLGEVLLKKGDAPAAIAAFRQSLERAPGRAQSLLGLARAEHLGGDNPAARKTYGTLLANWHAADADVPGLAEARAAGAGHAN